MFCFAIADARFHFGVCVANVFAIKTEKISNDEIVLCIYLFLMSISACSAG
jgi:hypothetical protein